MLGVCFSCSVYPCILLTQLEILIKTRSHFPCSKEPHSSNKDSMCWQRFVLSEVNSRQMLSFSRSNKAQVWISWAPSHVLGGNDDPQSGHSTLTRCLLINSIWPFKQSILLCPHQGTIVHLSILMTADLPLFPLTLCIPAFHWCNSSYLIS